LLSTRVSHFKHAQGEEDRKMPIMTDGNAEIAKTAEVRTDDRKHKSGIAGGRSALKSTWDVILESDPNDIAENFAGLIKHYDRLLAFQRSVKRQS
jgi:hypothetical protein